MPTSPSSTTYSADATVAHRKSLRVTMAGAAGTIIEYYDFAIYGYMATMIAVHFFVPGDPGASLLGTFATFAVAFFLRVPGGILFGHPRSSITAGRLRTWSRKV